MTTCVAVKNVRHILIRPLADTSVARNSQRGSCSVQQGDFDHLRKLHNRMPAGMTGRQNEYKKDMDKFVKNFVNRSVQVIVLSRAEGGVVYRTDCTTISSNQHWFLLNTQENEEVTAHLQKIWEQCHGRTVPLRSAVCLEMSMVTSSNERMVLEIWEFALLDETDPAGKQTYDLYCRLGILLKSLISVSRIVPAFRLAFGQRDDTYRLHYELCVGPMQEDKCGENSSVITVGKIGMLHGTFQVTVRYRTKLVLGSKEKARDDMVWQSNYFAKTENDHGNENNFERYEDFKTGSFDLPRNGKPNKPLNECSPYGAFAEINNHHIEDEPPMDLCDMFSTLLLDEDEMIPSKVEEKSYGDGDDEKEDDLYDETFQRPESILNKDQFVLIDMQKPAFADCSTELGIFFSGAPPVLKSLQTDTIDDETRYSDNPDTLERQYDKMKQQFNTFDDHFFAGVLNEVEH